MVRLSQADFQEHLKEQLQFIEASALSYDNGFEGEIKRLAVTVRVLVHDTNNSTSLLKSLNKKNIDFIDTSIPFDESNLSSHAGLIQTNFVSGKPAEFLPHLDDGIFNNKISFDSWWNGIIFVDDNRNEFSRKDIVQTLANKEGGAHVDEKLNKKYFDLRKNNSLGWEQVTADGKKTPLGDRVPATMRQISHEILKTLKDGYECHREKSNDHGVVVSHMGFYNGRGPNFPPKHNLPKNRPTIAGKKIGRNDPCTCGSGKKYKKCCML